MVLVPDTESYWANLSTHFSALEEYLTPREEKASPPRACVIGASDGKFVTPLLLRGWHVTAVEMDQTFLYGGTIELVETGTRIIKGLTQRLEFLGLQSRCAIIESDYMEWEPPSRFDLAITSGLWCMPQNRIHTLEELVHRQQEYVAPGGLFFADYLMATSKEERDTGFCPEPDEVTAMFRETQWKVHVNIDLGICGESHLGWEEWHYHRYGAVIAERLSL